VSVGEEVELVEGERWSWWSECWGRGGVGGVSIGGEVELVE
jgi:hypothetical protein